MIGHQSEKDNYNWKGYNIGYSGLHVWVEKHLGKPRKCSHCGTTAAKKFEWANISKQYKRNLTDWIRLCTSCHVKFDDKNNKGWITRRKNYGKITVA